MADFPGAARSNAVGFATDSFGYVGTGQVNQTALNDFYKYDPATNTWSAVANYPDSVLGAMGFAINNIGYVVCGIANSGNPCYAYDQSTNQWSPIAPMPSYMYNGFSAVANAKGYCGFGGIDSIYDMVSHRCTSKYLHALFARHHIGNSYDGIGLWTYSFIADH